MSGQVIEFRFSPRSRWEPVPAAYDIGAAWALYANYDLRIDGKVYLASERHKEDE